MIPNRSALSGGKYGGKYMSTKTSKTYPRQKTNYPGVFFRENSKKQKIFYIRYRRPGERKIIEDKLSGYGWTPARANTERAKRIEGTHYSNSEKRLEEKTESKQIDWTFNDLWQDYLKSKDELSPGLPSDKSKWNLYIDKKFGGKYPRDLSPLDIENLKRSLSKTHKVGTIRHVVGLLKRMVRRGNALKLIPPLDWEIQLPKLDSSVERIEILTKEQFQNLHKIWSTYPDRQVANLHKLIAWTGMRPSEALKLLRADIKISGKKGYLIKRKTKSGLNVTLQLNQNVIAIIQEQENYINSKSDIIRRSEYLFPSPKGGLRKLESYNKHFTKIRDLAGIPREYRPNYCLRDTLATMMLSEGATLDEVGYQLGHKPGSNMTQKYAKFIPDAQQRIVDHSERILKKLVGE